MKKKILGNKYRSYSSKALYSTQNLLNCWFLTGFTDADCYTLSILRNKKSRTGWVIIPSFQIVLHQKDKALLEQIQTYFGVGKVYKQSKESFMYQVKSVKDLTAIIAHFDKYPLITKKRADYELFKLAINCIKNKEHLTWEGLSKMVSIKASLNRGLSDELKAVFSNITPIARPLVQNLPIPDPYWLAGFVSGEGCYFVEISSLRQDIALGFQVRLRFKLAQHIRDLPLIQSLINYLDCGNVNIRSNKLACDFQVTKFADLVEKINPFFKKYSLLGVKSKDFADFSKVAELMKNKAHLTVKGLEQIREIKEGMNKRREFPDPERS